MRKNQPAPVNPAWLVVGATVRVRADLKHRGDRKRYGGVLGTVVEHDPNEINGYPWTVAGPDFTARFGEWELEACDGPG